MKNPIKARQSVPDSRMKYLLALAFLAWNATVLADTVAQSPLFLTMSVPPNVMLMVDNSGSMDTNVTVTSAGTTYNSATTYLPTANCNSNALPASTTTSTTTCTGSRRHKVCTTTTTTTPIVYTSTIPTAFFGKTTGSGSSKTTGTQCFADNLVYSVNSSLPIPADITTAAQKANYLNWYYSNEISKTSTTQTRLEIAKAAATALVDSVSDVRLGFSTLNGTTGGTLLEVIDDLTDTKKTNIKSRITALTASSWTPLAETLSGIGRYFATGYTGNLTLHPGNSNQASQTVSQVFTNNLQNGTVWSGRTAISGEPTFSTPPIQYSCQKSFSVLITDGLPTQDLDVSTYLTDYDEDCTKNPSSCVSATPNYDLKKLYFPGSSFPTGDNTSDYLDDVSQALFEMDLRPDLIKKAGAKNNVITYTIGIADDAINPTLPGVNPILRDAAIQGGGQFYFAGSASELDASLSNTFSIIAEQTASSSSVATNSTQFQTDTLLYQATFNSSDWGGHLLAFKLTTEDTNGNGNLDSGEDINGNGKIDAGGIGAQQWNATLQIPEQGARNIFSYNPQATTNPKGIEFLWSNLNTTQRQVLDTANAAAGSSPILDYLRGSNNNIQSNGGTLRDRTNRLGDIVNSDPLFVGREDQGYSSLPGAEGSSYSAFAATSRRAMIYAGANDGMLHGFDSGLSAEGGKEIFAYLPNAVISSELVTLTAPNYSHKYFVDGSAQAGDTYFNSAWNTILVGSMGAGTTTAVAGPTGLASGVGGRSVFALDITDPDLFDETNVLWEFSDRDDGDLGYTLPSASVVRLANGQWAAVVANGYNSSAGNAALFILNIQTGAVIKKMIADTTGNNGLSSPVTIDVDDDHIIDYIYAGDLKGNMWKFDVSSSDTANWGVAYGAPLFTATDKAATPGRQPITAKPTVSKAKATGQSTGVMVYFGTGKYFEANDNVVPASPQVQTFYSIWDICNKNSATTCNGSVAGRSLLQEQTILFEGSTGTTVLADGSSAAGDVRITSHCEVGYGPTSPTTTSSPCTNNINRRGWFMDLIPPSLAAQGERAVSTPILRNDRVIFTTLIPINTACTPGGTGWLMELDQNTGARLTGGTPFDINNDGKVDNIDLVKLDNTAMAASGLKSTVGIIKTPAIVACENGLDCKYASGSSGSLMTVKESAPITPIIGGVLGKRISWRQLR